MNVLERSAFYDALVEGANAGELSWGEVVRKLRVEVAGVDQATFSKMTKVSIRTIHKLESNVANPTLATLQSVLRPFGLRIGLVRSGVASSSPGGRSL